MSTLELFPEPQPNPALPTADDIYDAYPRKKHRLYALRCIKRAMKIVGPARLLELTQAYANAVSSWPKEDHDYIPYPSSWYNGGGYDDDPSTWRRKSKKGRASFA